MKADTFMNAVGLIDDRYLDVDIHEKTIVHRKWKKRFVSIVVAAALILCTLPTLTAFGVDPAYYILYHIAPSVAQTFKPIQKNCENNGIEMTVISAECNGSEASVYLAMHDITGTYPAGEWDLYDSYNINVPRNLIGNCSFSEYDADTHTAYFVVHLKTMDGSAMPNSKITFSVREMLLGKLKTYGTIDEIDMSSIPYEPQTTVRTSIGGMYYHDKMPNPAQYRFLIPNETPICSPAPGVSVMGIGYTDGALHILTKYEDKSHTDNHGFISLIDTSGNSVGEEIGFHYWDNTFTDSYTEQIFTIPYEDLSKYTLSGEFVTAQDYISGNWEITFPIG